MKKNRGNSVARAFVLFSVLALALVALCSFVSSENVTLLGDSTGQYTKVNVTMSPGGGTNPDVYFWLPEGIKAVEDVSLSVTTYPSASGQYPKDLSIDVGLDAFVDYMYMGRGYGEMNHQEIFYNDASFQTGLVEASAANSDPMLMLPSGATINQATLDILPRDVFDTANEVSVADIAGNVPRAVVLDADQDGDQDMAAVSYSGNSVVWLENQDVSGLGTGDATSWKEYTVVSNLNNTLDIRVADLDEDTRMDLIIVANSPQKADVDIVWYGCPADPTTQTWTEYIIESDLEDVDQMSVADYDDDGDLDLIVREASSNFYGYNNDGSPQDGGWVKEPLFVDDDNVGNFVVTDLDMDSDLDIVVLSGNISGSINVYTNPKANSNQSMWNILGIDNLPYDLAVIDSRDVDGDGYPDLIVATSNPSNNVYWLHSPGVEGITKTWDRHLLHQASGSITGLVAGDLSNDGLSDVLIATPSINEITLLYQPNDPGENSWFKDTLYTGTGTPSFVSIEDIDGTGDMQPLWTSMDDGEISWMSLDFSYLTDIGIDLGMDSNLEFSGVGEFNTPSQGVDVRTGLQKYLDWGSKPGNSSFTDDWGNEMVKIPIEVSGTGKGGVILNGMEVSYTYYGLVQGRNDRSLVSQLNNLIKQGNGSAEMVRVGVTTSSEGKVEVSGLDLEYNGAPKMVGILPSSVTVFEEHKDEHLLDLSPYFVDDNLQSDQLTYDIESNPEEEAVFIRVNDGTWLSVDATGATDYTGQFDIMLNVKDDIQNKLVFGPLTVIVENVNDEPVITFPIPDVRMDEDTTFMHVDLTNNFKDTDGDELFFEVSLVQENEDVSVYVETDDTIRITSINDHYSTETHTVQVKCDDDTDLTDSVAVQTFTLVIEPVNDKPFWKVSSLTVILDEDGSYVNVLDLRGYVDDLDHSVSDISFSIDSSTPAELDVRVNKEADHSWLNIIPNPDFFGERSFYITASDAGGLSANALVTVIVNPVNDIPVVDISSVTTGDVVFGSVMLSGYASDKEDDISVELKIDGQGYTTEWFDVSGTGSWGHMWQTEDQDLTDGLYVIAVRAFDGTEYSVTRSVGVILRNNPGQIIPDRDLDGIPDIMDMFPDNPFEWEDNDGDGFGDNTEDMFPNDPKEWLDTDLDGIGDNEDEHPYHYDEWHDSVDEPGPFGEDDTFFGLAIPWIIGGMTTISGILILIFGTEVGFVSFLYTLVFLYSKLSRKKVEDHEVRGLIRGYILANPGDHYSNIKKKLNLNNGTLAYHLKILEEREYIRSRRDGIYKRYYPERMRIDPSSAPLSTQERILNKVIENPGISRRDVAKGLQISRQVVNYHTKVLVNSGLITYRRDNGATIYFVVEES